MIISDQFVNGQPKEITLEIAYELGDTVYHRVGNGQPGIVTGYNLRPSGLIYYVSWGHLAETVHYSFELTAERPVG